MELQLKPNRWSCLATSFAMALDIPVARFFELVGHDGSDILHPELPEPRCRRGVHIQEAIEVAWNLGYSVTPFELMPAARTTPDGPVHAINFPGGNWERFSGRFSWGLGVIECVTRTGGGHAVAFDAPLIYDPDEAAPYLWSRDAMEQRGLFTRTLWRIERRPHEQTEYGLHSALDRARYEAN